MKSPPGSSPLSNHNPPFILKRTIYNVLWLLLSAGLTTAQPTYNMSNQTVDDCKGFLLDSEQGDIGGTYDHNENYTFSICIPGVQQITLNFTSFCTELDFDYMRFYDGPDTLSMQIGPAYTGDADPPPITAFSGCLTVNFISDASVTCDGWNAWWCVDPIIPPPPEILPMANVPCESNSLTIQFADPVPCDSVYATAFQVVGPQSPNVVSATPAPCIGGMTTSVVLTLSSPIEASGDYTVYYYSYYSDPCLEAVPLVSTVGFSVVDCPLFVSLSSDADPLCEGDCTLLTAQASGGEEGTYTYTWMPALPNTAIVEVCPASTTTYNVTVTDALGATSESSLTISVNPAPVIDPDNLSICQSEDPFFLSANPAGGTWSGSGVADENTGYYDPGLVDDLNDVVTYTDNNGCTAQLNIDFLALDEGTDDAACPGSTPFYVSGGMPPGGTWSGTNIAPDGLFTPPATADSFLVTYTHPNGCAGSKWIHVADIVMPMLDTLCQSLDPFVLPVTPVGGIWSGPGITDPETGYFDPSEAQAGANLLYYDINGCTDSMVIDIKGIFAGGNFSACPEQAPFIVPGNWGPTGGIWTGLGIIDSITGMYDPNLPNGTNDTLTFTVDGCVATRLVRVRQTNILQNSPLVFCIGDEELILHRDYLDFVPCCGVWSGPGVGYNGDDYYFDPDQAGPGNHLLYYDRNTCTDSMEVIVGATPIISPLTICEEELPVTLSGSEPGIWSGSGIVDEINGIFDPGAAGLGDHTIYLESVWGCVGQQTIHVFPMEIASIEDMPSYYCYKDTVVIVPVNPAGGALFVNDQPATYFNPAESGEGVHRIRYEIGAGECFSADSIFVEVGAALAPQAVADADTLCHGHSTTITASVDGGTGDNIVYTWNQGLGFGKTHFVTPQAGLTVYTVSIQDGCSDPVTAALPVWVHPPIQAAIETGEAVCFEDSTYATVNAFPQGDYDYLWDTDPPTPGEYLYSYPSTYEVAITNLETGCVEHLEVELPGYDLLTANFDIAPNEDCISIIDPDIQVIDYSVGATGGYWNFGDGSPNQPYHFGANISHSYADTGTYVIQLYLENEGNCVATHELTLCVEPTFRLFAPNAMTPDYNGYNDVFRFKGRFISSIEWQVFNRWGELIFTGQSLDDEWDGTHKGQLVPQGVYVYLAKYVPQYEGVARTMKGFITVLRN